MNIIMNSPTRSSICIFAALIVVKAVFSDAYTATQYPWFDPLLPEEIPYDTPEFWIESDFSDYITDDEDVNNFTAAGGPYAVWRVNGMQIDFRSGWTRNFKYTATSCHHDGHYRLEYLHDAIVPSPNPIFVFAATMWLEFNLGVGHTEKVANWEFIASSTLDMYTDSSWKCLNTTTLTNLGYNWDKHDNDETEPKWYDVDYDDSSWPNAIELGDYDKHRNHPMHCMGQDKFMKYIHPSAKIIWHSDLSLQAEQIQSQSTENQYYFTQEMQATFTTNVVESKLCQNDRQYCNYCRRRYVNQCHHAPCSNGGTCTNVQNWLDYECACAAGTTGRNCEIDIDECISSPCDASTKFSTCEDLLNGYRCACASGFTGETCDDEIDECSSNPCQNGGSCSDQINSFACSCVTGYTGPDCSSEENECSSNPCGTHGNCSDQSNSYTCNCKPGYSGSNCEIEINVCDSSPCENGGNCIRGIITYSCDCVAGFSGDRCSSEIDECSSNPCPTGTRCIDNINSYTCIDACSSDPCEGGLTCEIDFSTKDYRYICISACRSNPCQNGLTCELNTTTKSYSCKDYRPLSEYHDSSTKVPSDHDRPLSEYHDSNTKVPSDHNDTKDTNTLVGNCPKGTFGKGCAKKCYCRDDVGCDVVTGMCPHGCATGYTGNTCSHSAWIGAGQKSAKIDTTAITTGFLVPGLVAGIVIGLYCFFKRKRNKNPTLSRRKLDPHDFSQLDLNDR